MAKKQTVIKLSSNSKFKLPVEECPFYQKKDICEDTGKKCSESMDAYCKKQFCKIA